MKVDILYDIQHSESSSAARIISEAISSIYGIDINMVICAEGDLLNKLGANPNYDFVILHLANSRDGAYREASRCRSLTNAVLVAESAICPKGKDEVLEHFDYYTRPLYDPCSLEDLLSEYGFIEKEE